MKKRTRIILISSISLLVLILALLAAGIYILFFNATFETVDQYSETWIMPDRPYDLNQAVLDGEAFLLPYREDGSFTILQLTDPHLRRGPFSRREKVYELLELAFEQANPDLVAVTGDLVFSANAKKMLREFAQFMEEQEQYWIYVFGNHDGEYIHKRSDLVEVLKDYPHALFSPGPDWVLGESDYVLALVDAQGVPQQALIMLDSHGGRKYEVDGKQKVDYDYIYPSQIAWYQWVSQSLEVPLYAFFHIPLPEYDTLWNDGLALGGSFEDTRVCAPMENTGLFDVMVQDGYTVVTFCGHDHLNDYWGIMDGITLVYGRSASWGSYGSKTFEKGVTIIKLHQDTPRLFGMETLTESSLGM